MLRLQRENKVRTGFTIVELLIVVVVIAILAAITIVAYNGITTNAKESALKSDLSTAAKKLNLAKVEGDGSYPTAAPANTSTTTYQYNRISANQFCLTATSPDLPGKAYSITESGTIQTGACPLPVATTMQQFTSAHCAERPIYTGSNPSAIQTLTDSRGGTERTYEVAKLADNKCWMLTNLKLGSTTGTITLTPADSNVASNFTLPQIKNTDFVYDTTTNPGNNYDTPYAYGPVPSDTGSGATNYGYLYNWSAATAGETRTTKPAGSGDANYSICPANWRLPTGGLWNATTNEFSNLSARMADLTGVTDPGYTSSNYSGALFSSNWQPNGRLKVVFSGNWASLFSSQSSYGYLWSRSVLASSASDARNANFNSSDVNPANSSTRFRGLGVRCLLN